jgi:hypothetical protein
MSYKTREEWLEAAMDHLIPMVETHTGPFQRPRVSCGFCVQKNYTGITINSEICEDGVNQIFISPMLDAKNPADPTDGVLQVLLHELCHAALPEDTGHKKPFAKLAAAVGLEEPWTATTASAGLEPKLKEIATALGPYPHARIDIKAGKKQTTRMIKCECPDCGYVCRTTKQWIDSAGAPLCPCNETAMEVDSE